MVVHILKTARTYWFEVQNGLKPFEVRKDDRNPPYETGDVVGLVNKGAGPGYGDVLVRRVGYLARGGRIPKGYCVFMLAPPVDSDRTRVEMAMGVVAVST